MSTYQTTSFSQKLVDIFSTYGLVQDRLPGDELVLPNEWNDIKINVNDLVVSDTINYSLEKLYVNWLYMTSYSVIPTNDIPDAVYNDRMIIDSGEGVDWSASSDWSESVSDGELRGVNHLIKIQNIINPENFNIIAATTTNIILLSGTDTTSVDVIVNPDALGSIIRSDSSVTHPSNGIYFEEIADIVVSDNVDLFVLDSIHKTIFKFDISGITTLDEAVLKNDTPGRLLTAMVGGVGSISDKTKFVNPLCCVSVNNNIYVVDRDPVSKIVIVKVFDSFLNWRSSHELTESSILDIKDINYNTETESFYFLYHTAGIGAPGELHVYDSNFVFVKKDMLMDLKKHGIEMTNEIHRRVYFSIENKNIMYLVTDKNVYKKYVTRPSSFIGRFKFNDQVRGVIGPDDSVRDIKDMSIFYHPLTNNDITYVKDEILLFESGRDGVYRFIEDSGFENSLESEIDEKILLFEQLKVKESEPVDIITYNKLFYKSLYNNLLLLESTSRKFSTVFDSRGYSIYIGFQYLNNEELSLLNYEINSNCFISSNEVVTTHTVNRCLYEIYKLQLDIVNNMQEKSINVFPLVDVPVFL